MITKFPGWILVTITFASWMAALCVVAVLGLSTMGRPTPLWIGASSIASTTAAAVIGCWAFLECPKGSVFSKIITAISALVAVLFALINLGIYF